MDEEKPLHEVLNITPLQNQVQTVKNEVAKAENTEDFETARENIKNIITKGADILDVAIDVAKGSEHPRSFEVVSQLIQTLVNANKDLLEIRKKQKEITGHSGDQQFGNVEGDVNTIFVGNTSELQKFLREKKAIKDKGVDVDGNV